MTLDYEDASAPDPGGAGPGPPAATDSGGTEAAGTRRARIRTGVARLIDAIRRSDDAAVERAVLQLSAQRRWLAPLALVVGAFLMLFQGVKLLVTNWRLTLVQIVPAMWIWIAMLDIKIHTLHGKGFHVLTRADPHPRHRGRDRPHRRQLLSERRLRVRHLGARYAADPPGLREGEPAHPDRS